MLRLNRIGITIFFLAAAASCLSPSTLPLLVQASDDVDDSAVENLDVAAATPEEPIEQEAEIEHVEESVTEEVAPEVIEVVSEEAEPSTEEEIDATASAVQEEITRAEGDAAALKESVNSRIAESLVKPIALAKKNAKKVAVIGVSVWGAATGIGWAMQNYGTGPIKKD